MYIQTCNNKSKVIDMGFKFMKIKLHGLLSIIHHVCELDSNYGSLNLQLLK